MISVSLFVILLIAVVLGLLWKKITAIGTLILGTLFGLASSGTAFGASVLGAFQTFIGWVVSLAATVGA